jgi:hypothetical protein
MLTCNHCGSTKGTKGRRTWFGTIAEDGKLLCQRDMYAPVINLGDFCDTCWEAARVAASKVFHPRSFLVPKSEAFSPTGVLVERKIQQIHLCIEELVTLMNFARSEVERRQHGSS